MSMNLSLYIAKRYRKAKAKNRFISFIAFSSTFGIGLGVAALIIALSVMNGFEREMVNRLLSIVPHIEYVAVDRPIYDWRHKLQQIESHSEVVATAPFVPVKGMVQKGEALHGIEIRGIDAQLEQSVSNIQQYLIAGDWQSIDSQQQSLVLGSGIADQLGLTVGSSVQVMMPQQAEGLTLKPPKYANLTVTGIFKMGGQLDFSLGYININNAQALTGLEEGAITGIRLKIADVYAAESLSREIAMQMTDVVYMISWFRSQGHLYNDIQLVRFIMYLVLFIVIAVASFNIVSTLVMAVKEKQSDIAILKTMGASDNTIVFTFMLQGLGNGIRGVGFGAIIGVIVAWQVPQLFSALEQLFNVQFLENDVYFINFIPSQLMWKDVAVTVSMALATSFLATIYPARQATKIQPAVILGQG